jgi:hypothetical protein
MTFSFKTGIQQNIVPIVAFNGPNFAPAEQVGSKMTPYVNFAIRSCCSNSMRIPAVVVLPVKNDSDGLLLVCVGGIK